MYVVCFCVYVCVVIAVCWQLLSAVLEASYQDIRYKGTSPAKDSSLPPSPLASLSIVGLSTQGDTEIVAEQGRLAVAVSRGVTLARDVVGTWSICTP